MGFVDCKMSKAKKSGAMKNHSSRLLGESIKKLLKSIILLIIGVIVALLFAYHTLFGTRGLMKNCRPKDIALSLNYETYENN